MVMPLGAPTDRDRAETTLRLLLVDAHASSREALAFLFDREPDLAVVGQAGTLAEARTLLAEGAVADLALIGLDLPDGHGADLIQDLRRDHPEALVLVLTGSRYPKEHARALAAGAAQVLTKHVSTAELLAMIRRICAGEVFLPSPELVQLLPLLFEEQAQAQRVDAAFAQLSQRQREILQQLAEGLSDRGIAERLFISEKTVRNQMTALMAMLEVDSRVQVLLLAHRRGVVTLR